MDPLVGGKSLPREDRDASAGTQRAADVRKRRDGIAEEHDALTADGNVERRGLERIDGRIGKHEIERQALRRDLPCARQHRHGDVDAEHKARWRDPLRQRDRGRTAATADIEDSLAGFRARAIDQNLRNRRQQHVLHWLPVGPVLTGNSVPECDLIGISFVAGGNV